MHISSRVKLTIIFSLLLLFVVGLALRGFGSMPTHASGSSQGWRIVPSPLVGGSTLNAVAAVSATSAWAVGCSSIAPLIEHWNGKLWSVVPSPYLGAGGMLNAVKALSVTNVWTVGNAIPSGSALIEHYNGFQWSIVPSPSAGDGYTTYSLTGMTVLSSTNIWASGYSSAGGGSQTLIEHYDGFQWGVVPSQNEGMLSRFNAINASSPTDVWAVGDSQGSSHSESTLVEHWDGFQWSIVGSPTPGLDDSLNAVIAFSPNDVRAVGTSSSSSYALAEHWDGIQWTNGVPPNEGLYGNWLQGEVAFTANNIWAVGAYENSSYVINVLVEHWDGKHWTIVASPNTSSTNNGLQGITKVPGTTTLWAVGGTTNGAIIEFYT